MSILNKLNQVQSPSTNGGGSSFTDPNALQKQELEFLLSLIKHSNFRGDQLEILYNIVIKLQNQYTNT